jgi:maltokinase
MGADAWLRNARATFLGAYGQSDPSLLAAFELEKACYEVRYEAAMRPEWLWLPMAALGRLVA